MCAIGAPDLVFKVGKPHFAITELIQTYTIYEYNVYIYKTKSSMTEFYKASDNRKYFNSELL